MSLRWFLCFWALSKIFELQILYWSSPGEHCHRKHQTECLRIAGMGVCGKSTFQPTNCKHLRELQSQHQESLWKNELRWTEFHSSEPWSQPLFKWRCQWSLSSRAFGNYSLNFLLAYPSLLPVLLTSANCCPSACWYLAKCHFISAATVFGTLLQ